MVHDLDVAVGDELVDGGREGGGRHLARRAGEVEPLIEHDRSLVAVRDAAGGGCHACGRSRLSVRSGCASARCASGQQRASDPPDRRAAYGFAGP